MFFGIPVLSLSSKLHLYGPSASAVRSVRHARCPKHPLGCPHRRGFRILVAIVNHFPDSALDDRFCAIHYREKASHRVSPQPGFRRGSLEWHSARCASHKDTSSLTYPPPAPREIHHQSSRSESRYTPWKGFCCPAPQYMPRPAYRDLWSAFPRAWLLP